MRRVGGLGLDTRKEVSGSADDINSTLGHLQRDSGKSGSLRDKETRALTYSIERLERCAMPTLAGPRAVPHIIRHSHAPAGDFHSSPHATSSDSGRHVVVGTTSYTPVSPSLGRILIDKQAVPGVFI